MEEDIYRELLAAREAHRACALVTVTQTKGSVPRAVGAKMLVYEDGTIAGTVGGGKFESLVSESAQDAMQNGEARTLTLPLHEASDDSFGAICGGEVTVFIEPVGVADRLFILGAGHCGQALANAAELLGYRVWVLDDRKPLLESTAFRSTTRIAEGIDSFLTEQSWETTDALVLVNRNYQLDTDALRILLAGPGPGYLGMIGSTKKVREVFNVLRADGIDDAKLKSVHAPIGLDIGADSPAEIAVAVLAEIIAFKQGKGRNAGL